MNKLRNIAIAMLGAIVVFSIAGVAFAFFEMWLIAIILLFATIFVGVLSVLLSARYMTWNARSGEQRLKQTTQKLSARVSTFIKQQRQSNDELRELVTSASELVTATRAAQQRAFAGYQKRLDALEEDLAQQITNLQQSVASGAKSTRQQLTSVTRDGTRQVEALVHIYQRYPEVKLPMPSTGRWAIDSQALAHLIALVEERKPQRILELGSGTSTIWLGYLCRSQGGAVVTVDHLEEYLQKTRIAIDRHQLDDIIDSRLAPLEPVEISDRTYDWYALASLADLSNVDMVVIDGPPASTGPQARYPALPKLIELLSPNVTVVLDDAHRSDEAKIVEAWLDGFPEFREIEQGTSRLAVLERNAE